MKREYRIRQHVCENTIRKNGQPYTFYFIEYNYLSIFGIKFWKRITNFKPIIDTDVFLTKEEAKDVITKFANYKKCLDHDNEIVETVEI